MADLKPVYLLSGDDDARIDDWRVRLRRRAEAEEGPGALETYEARSCPPTDLVAALQTLSLSMGRRYLLVDGVEAWKADQLEPVESALTALPPATTLVLVVRGKAPARLTKAVEAAGGEARSYAGRKPWQLPEWVVERAQAAGLRLDTEAARALVARAGTRQHTLAREIERLAILAHPEGELSAEQVTRIAAGEVSPQAYDLADAIVAGDVEASLALAEGARAGDERPARLLYPIVRRLREVHRAVALLEAGRPEGTISRELRMPPWAAKRTLAQARAGDRDRLERALCAFADLEVDMRGGGELDEDTAFSLTLVRAAG